MGGRSLLGGKKLSDRNQGLREERITRTIIVDAEGKVYHEHLLLDQQRLIEKWRLLLPSKPQSLP